MANEISNGSSLKVLVTKADFIDKKTQEPKVLIGFGSVSEYEEGKVPGARDVMGKVSAINAFLQATSAGKIPLTLKTTDENGKSVYMKADCYRQSGVSKAGMGYSYQKMSFELQPERRNEAGELIQNKQALYATKGRDGYAFDKDQDQTLVEKFNKLVSKGVDITLTATNPKTLENYPQLMNVVNQIGSAAMIGVNFVRERGAVLSGEMQDVSKKGNEIGQGVQQLAGLATPSKDQGMEI